MRKFIKPALVAVASFAATGAALADVPAGVTTAITSGGADGLVVVGALAAAGASFLLIRKVLSKTGITL